MSRGLGNALAWRRALWLRRAPGKGLGTLLLALPVAFLIPLESAGTLGTRAQAISAEIWIASLFLALAIRGGGDLRDPAFIWLHQRGCSAGETAVQNWLLDVGFMATVGLWWALAGSGVLATLQPVTLLNFLSFALLGASVGILAHSVSFLFSAWGHRRPGDLVALFAFLSLLLPGITLEAPARVVTLLDWALPSFHATLVLSGAVRGGDSWKAAEALIQVLSYSGASLGLGYWRISRWKPHP